MRKDNAIKIQYASKYASIANYWKKWIEKPRTSKSNAVAVKKRGRKAFQQKNYQSWKKKNTELADFERTTQQLLLTL
jgi:hypothetical protein